MNLKDFVGICIDKAEKADDVQDYDESIRLLELAKSTIQKTIDDVLKARQRYYEGLGKQ